MLFLLLLDHLAVGFFALDRHLLGLLELPQSILHILFLLEQFVLHFVVVPEEEHLVVDQGFEGVGLEAHVHQEDEVLQQS